MGELYKNPLRVYLVLALLAAWGIYAGFSLPISLFPNSTKPMVHVEVPYGGLATDDFYQSYGRIIESQLRGIIVDNKSVAKLESEYSSTRVHYKVEFSWGVEGRNALSEVQSAIAGLSAGWPEESKRYYKVFTWNENGGFIAISFYSSTRSMDELYELLQPIFLPLSSQVPDANNVALYNPNQKQIQITLDPERMALMQVNVSIVEDAIRTANISLGGGSMHMGDQNFSIEMPRQTQSLDTLRNLPFYSLNGKILQLRDIADVQLKTNTQSSRIFKTSGVPSLILFAEPKPGSNVKKMSEDVIRGVEKAVAHLPKDVEYKVLVNPAEFINSSVHSVVKEVALAALLAVVILLIFIGSLKNVVTAAIEIPLSIVMAFIFMKLFDMNLNLISLGGLALSAGMNVDASVVVMENIFRKFDLAKGEMTAGRRLQTVIEAVNEVKLPVIASTIASLVVFLPLILTDGLTNAILGDLAKAVVFSHSMSAIVALVLVPTVRLQMMRTEKIFHLKSPIEKQFLWLESVYVKILHFLIRHKKAQWSFYSTLLAGLIVLAVFVLPKLRLEIIGRPETDWLMLGFHSATFTSSRQVDSFAEKLEYELLQELDDKVAYTFTQISGTDNGVIMIRLKNRTNIDHLWKQLEEKYVNTPTIYYWSEPWNPSELPIPDPDHFRIEIRGGNADERRALSNDLSLALMETQIFPRVRVRPESGHFDEIVLSPHSDVIKNMGRGFSTYELANYVRVATDGKNIGEFTLDQKTYDMELNMFDSRVSNIQLLKSLPVSTGDKIVPLNALTDISTQTKKADVFSIDQGALSVITARTAEIDKLQAPEKKKQAMNFLSQWLEKNSTKNLIVNNVPPDIEITEALNQLKWALILSVLLIFVTMVVQFGDLVHAALVLVAVPLGFIGVLISLFVFNSTLSLNSALGTILLSGIAVANSIILVDFMKKLVDDGLEPVQAALTACRARLRPILMTSLTTVLGMMPIALGLGEGGRILQPLGISVAGGLWISMLLTIFVVPALQVAYLQRKSIHTKNEELITQVKKVDWTEPRAEL